MTRSSTAACYNALFHCSLGGGESILDAELLLLHLHLGGSADLDDSYTASQLGQTLLELLTVEVGGGGFDFGADLSHTGLSISSLLARTADDDGVLLAEP